MIVQLRPRNRGLGHKPRKRANYPINVVPHHHPHRTLRTHARRRRAPHGSPQIICAFWNGCEKADIGARRAGAALTPIELKSVFYSYIIEIDSAGRPLNPVERAGAMRMAPSATCLARARRGRDAVASAWYAHYLGTALAHIVGAVVPVVCPLGALEHVGRRRSPLCVCWDNDCAARVTPTNRARCSVRGARVALRAPRVDRTTPPCCTPLVAIGAATGRRRVRAPNAPPLCAPHSRTLGCAKQT